MEQNGDPGGDSGLSTAAIIAVAAACAVLFATIFSVIGIVIRNHRAKAADGNSQPSLHNNMVRCSAYFILFTLIFPDFLYFLGHNCTQKIDHPHCTPVCCPSEFSSFPMHLGVSLSVMSRLHPIDGC